MLEATRAGRVWRSRYRLSHTKRALGGKESQDIMEGVYFDALFETIRNLANLRIKVLNIATVDARGVIYITAFGVSCQPELYRSGTRGFYTYIIRCAKTGAVYIHIGVGSDVVCSTLMGSARASDRGTDNRTDSRFFMSVRLKV